MSERNIKLVRFIGGRRYLEGVPARDLSADEWAQFSRKQQRHLTQVLKLYEVIYDEHSRSV